MPAIRTRHLGNSGLVVSALGLGCNSFGSRSSEEASKDVIDAAIEEGISFFDTSDSYGEGRSEEIIGQSLKGRRDDIIIATKCGEDLQGAIGADFGPRGSRRYIRRAIEHSLRRLQTDWIDLYQIHYPDPHTPMEETLSALDELIHEGKTRYVGCSNHNSWQITEADWIAHDQGLNRFISTQNRYSLMDRATEEYVLPACRHLGIGLIAFRPLARGLLTGKYRRESAPPVGSRLESLPAELSPDRFTTLERLEAFAHGRGHSLLDLAIGAVIAREGVATVIAGASTPEQVRANGAAAQWIPTAHDLEDLDLLTSASAP